MNNVTIYGAGAIGGWIGAKLALAGCAVSVVARGETLAAEKPEEQAANGGVLFRAERRARP